MELNQQIDFIEHLTTRPSMWVWRPSYDSITAFLVGYDHALHGGLLEGYREWLTMKFGYGHNLAWPALLVIDALGEDALELQQRSAQDEKLLLERLRESLTEYLRYRDQIGLRNVLFDHGVWLRKQHWFNENVERFGTSTGIAPDSPDKPED